MAAVSSRELLKQMVQGAVPPSFSKEITLIVCLSAPSILSQISSVLMQYIDAAMVGRIGAVNAAAIGLVETTLWLFGSVAFALSTGFSVLCSHKVGALNYKAAAMVFYHALIFMLCLCIVMTGSGLYIKDSLPYLLGGQGEVCELASSYFTILILGFPLMVFTGCATGMLQAHGNMKVAGLLNTLSCLLDVIFNFFFIFDECTFDFLGYSVSINGLGLMLDGAAYGTVLSHLLVCALLYLYILKRTSILELNTRAFKFRFAYWRNALRISAPIAIQNVMMMSAMVITTSIVAGLGNTALAANNFGITAESLCFMAGYGLQSAACAIVGQSYGAKNRRLTISFAKICTWLCMIIMGLLGIALYAFAPFLMSLLTVDEEVIALGADILRIEAFAEPLFGASIVISGIMRGTGYTLIPGVMNLISIYGVRLTLAFILCTDYGLYGVWTAMAVELCFRGIIFLIKLRSMSWLGLLR